MKYKRIILKLSGEALASKDGVHIYDKTVLSNIHSQVSELLKQGLEVAIVVGGGNIWRGAGSAKIDLILEDADYMGMMATSINAKALESFFTLKNLPVSNYNSLEFESIAPKVDAIKADLDLKAGKVVIFGGGTGKPFLSTDTAAAMRAIDIKAEVILMAKNGVDGVYTSDPKKNADARHIPELTFDDVIQQNLQVVDKEAMQLLKGKNIDILLFNMNQDNSIIGIFNNESQNKTIIKDN